MRILVAGRSGQVARSLAARAGKSAHHITAIGRPELDLCTPASIERVLAKIAPDIVINAAAYTAVDQAEAEEALAIAVNADGAGALARQTCDLDIPIIHLSTDYVFDGTLQRAYKEDDPAAPLGAYGRSKLAGEDAVRAGNDKHVICRTAWLYSQYENNFLKTMLRLANTGNRVRVVDDQTGNPTYAGHLADALLTICDSCTNTEPQQHPAWGTYNVAAQGEASWAEFAETIFQENAALGGSAAKVQRIPSTEFPTSARRPANSRLDTSRLARDWGIVLPDWRQGVRDCIRYLRETET